MKEIAVGDIVTRMLAGTVPQQLRVSEVTPTLIMCGHWVFDRATGAEVDDYLNWGPPPRITGSFLRDITGDNHVEVSDIDALLHMKKPPTN